MGAKYTRNANQYKQKTGFSRKVLGGSKQGLRRSTRSCTRKEHESATNSIAKRGQGAIAPCRVKGQRPLWGLGQRPNCWSGRSTQRKKSTKGAGSEASLPVTLRVLRRAPQAALPPRVREEPKNRLPVWDSPLKDYTISRMEKAQADGAGESGNSITPCSTRSSAFRVHPAPFRRLPDFRRARRGRLSASAPCRRGGR